MSEATALLVSDHFGVFIPQNFVHRVNHIEWHINDDDAGILNQGPEHPDYWETWDDVLQSAYFEDEDGNVWLLYQDGDLWAYCEDLMGDDEKEEFFGG